MICHFFIKKKNQQQHSLMILATMLRKKNLILWDFPGGPVVENPPCKAGDMSLIPGRGSDIPYVPWGN